MKRSPSLITLPIRGLSVLCIIMLQPTDISQPTSIAPATKSFTDKLPLTDSSTTDKLITHRSSMQLITDRFSTTISVADKVVTVSCAIIASFTDSVPLTDSSTTDKSFTHKCAIQLVTVRLSIVAFVAERFVTNSSNTDNSVIVALVIIASSAVRLVIEEFCTISTLTDNVPVIVTSVAERSVTN